MGYKVKQRGLVYKKQRVIKAEFGVKTTPDQFSYDNNPFDDSALFGTQSKGNFLQSGQASGKNSFKRFSTPTAPDFNAEAVNLDKPAGYNFGTGTGSKTTSSILSGNNLNMGSQKAYNAEVKKVSTPITPTGGDKVGAATGIASMAGSALSNTTDGKDNTFTKKEAAGTISGTALKSAATGASLAGTAVGLIGTTAATSLATTAATSVGIGAATAATGAVAGSIVPIVGTAIGLVIGTAVGIFKAKKAKKKAAGVQNSMDIKNAAMQSAENRNNNSLRDSLLVGSTPNTSSVNSDTENIAGSYPSRKFGGTFHYTLKKKSIQSPIVERSLEPVKIFKRGGGIKPTENIIPNGVLHEEENKLGDKGMPVVKCTKEKCVKKYEIEKEEMIFTLDTTKKVEALVKGGDLKKLGTFVKEQVLDNTHSFTDKFNDLNNYKRKNESIHA